MKKPNLRSVPVFKNEDEERDFWATADSSKYFDFARAEEIIFTNLKSTRESISLRLPTPLLSKIKLIANRKDIPYQSLIKTYLAESVSKDFKLL